MKKLSLVLLMSYLALTLGGCGLFQKSEEPSEEPPVAKSPSETPKKSEKTDEIAVTPTAPPTSNLIPSTDPNTRRNEIKKPQDKNNPFAFLPLAPVVKAQTETSGVTNTKPGAKPGPSRGGATNVAATGSGGSRGGVTNAVAAENLCLAESSSASSVPAPSLPIPNEARGVVVSGIVKFNGTPVAIVKAPNENVARQVTEGAALSNGQIRVKSINASSLKPYIVLEQYGLDVSRAVGEPAEEPVEAPTPPITPPEASGYGTVNNLVLQQVEIKEENSANPLVNGTMCNSGDKTLQVSTLTLQISEKGTKKIISSMRVELPTSYTIEPGIQADFDGRIGSNDNSQKSESGLRGRQKGDVTITLKEWS
ncbi:hypothetical protein [Crocosphaera sp. XPORK-15E]|uniref:hypothetical protein n=1 Tax=Crocosphaera sp. XPORK-15E TaxID=3110247 RepID=UPI002B20E0D4|nr:hypothetical protein [Crocosphaera sp. XPORK-15E]MEA5533591.1 hypothetical protein [Crocosphaera sp. XPORK-15E]